jgi:hypothetical protein
MNRLDVERRGGNPDRAELTLSEDEDTIAAPKPSALAGAAGRQS